MSRRVYVAGAINSGNVIGCLSNIRKGIRASTKILLDGEIPYCPFLDFQFFLALDEHEEITFDMIRNYSMTWLEVSNIVVVLPESDASVGTQAEIARAHELGIPVMTWEEYWRERNLNRG